MLRKVVLNLGKSLHFHFRSILQIYETCYIIADSSSISTHCM